MCISHINGDNYYCMRNNMSWTPFGVISFISGNKSLKINYCALMNLLFEESNFFRTVNLITKCNARPIYAAIYVYDVKNTCDRNSSTLTISPSAFVELIQTLHVNIRSILFLYLSLVCENFFSSMECSINIHEYEV